MYLLQTMGEQLIAVANEDVSRVLRRAEFTRKRVLAQSPDDCMHW